jgi:ring-1,2-phenylacetyl-CoA epoxidase subunit PaaE
MQHFHSLPILEKKFETSSCVSLSFRIPEELKEAFQFEAGQYLTFRTWIDGEEVRRSYSLCSSPSEDELRVAIKKVPMGKFSTHAVETLEAGDDLDVMAPMGHFVKHSNNPNPTYVMVAAGSGITPVMSLMKDILEKEPTARIFLFYGNRSTDQIIFKEEIESLKNRYMNRLMVNYIMSQEDQESPLFNGRIDAEKFGKFCDLIFGPDEIAEYFICGPEPMIWAVRDTLLSRQVDETKIRFELFTSSTAKKEVDFVGELEESDKDEVSTVTIILDGIQSEFELGYTGKTILDAALEKDHDLPYACKGGVCCTCKARLLEGEVEMEVNYALEPDEVEKGYILTCQSHPRTKTLKVDYDV